MSKWGYLVVLLLLCGLVACQDGADSDGQLQTILPLEAVNSSDLQVVTGQTVFVPAYAEVFHASSRSVPLTVTLAVHNTDSQHPIIIQSVRYYNSDGQLVRDYAQQPLQLNPLATTGFVVGDDESSGGFGANFVVEWVAEQPVFEPVIEAVMINTSNQQGLALISPGRVLSQVGEAD